MENKDRISKIKEYEAKKVLQREMKLIHENTEIANMEYEIKMLYNRIDNLIQTANAAIKAGIKISFASAIGQDYNNHYFIANDWSHLLGFVEKVENPGMIYQYVSGVKGLAIYDCGSKIEVLKIESTGNYHIYCVGDRVKMYERFVKEFDELEEKFYAYIDKTITR